MGQGVDLGGIGAGAPNLITGSPLMTLCADDPMRWEAFPQPLSSYALASADRHEPVA